MHVYKPPPVGGLDRVPVYTAGTGTTRADLFELDGVTPMPGNVLVADTSGNLPSFQCATSPVYVGTSGSRATWQPNESGDAAPTAASSAPAAPFPMAQFTLIANGTPDTLTVYDAAGTGTLITPGNPTGLAWLTWEADKSVYIASARLLGGYVQIDSNGATDAAYRLHNGMNGFAGVWMFVPFNAISGAFADSFELPGTFPSFESGGPAAEPGWDYLNSAAFGTIADGTLTLWAKDADPNP